MKKLLVILAVLLLVIGCFVLVACENVDNETVSDAMTIANLKSEVSKAFDKLTYTSDLMIDSERGVISFTVENSISEITVSEINLSSGSVSAASTDGNALTALALNEGQNTFLLNATSGTITVNYTLKITRKAATTEPAADPDPTTEPTVDPKPTTDPTTEPTVDPDPTTDPTIDPMDDPTTDPSLDPEPTHTHTYADTWSKDADYHWHAATCEHTDEVKDRAAHDWQVTFTNPATKTADGFILYACSVCGATKTETLPPIGHTHVYGSLITEVPATCTSTGTAAHYECSGCDKVFDEEKREVTAADLVLAIDPDNHDLVHRDAQVPTCTEIGWNAYDYCSRCDYTTYVELPATGHSYSDTWSWDSEAHWRAATCEHTNEVTDYAAHLFGDWETDREADYENAGAKHRTCSVCLYVENAVIPMLERERYTISFDLNGGVSSSVATPISVTELNVSDFFFDVTKEGYTFHGWAYDGVTVFDENGVKLDEPQMTASMTFTAVFTQTIRLFITTNMPEAGTISGAGEYAYDTEVDVAAHPYQGYEFVGWVYSNAVLSNQEDYRYKMWDRDVTITARFKLANFDLRLTSNNEGKGVVFIDPTGYNDLYEAEKEKSVTYKSVVTVAAYTKTATRFLGWFDEENALVTTNAVFSFRMPNHDYSLVAKWDYFTISYVLNDGTNNESNPTIYSSESEDILFAAPTLDSYTFDGWYTDEDFTAPITGIPAGSYDDVTLYAKWVYYTVTTETNLAGAGTYTLKNEEKVTAGQSVTLTAETNAGYTWVGWYDGDEKVCDDLSYTFEMPAENKTYTATWTYYTVTTATNDADAGTYTLKNEEKVTAGQSVTLTAETNAGYTWLGWYEGEKLICESPEYVLAMPLENKTYTAKWTYYTVTTETNLAEAGAYTEKNAEKVTAGQSVTLTAETSAGYTWVGWYDGDEKVCDDLSYTFVMPAENKTYTATWTVSKEMRNFTFTSTASTCTITGIKDKSVAEIIVPDYVTSIGSSAFSDCSLLTSIVIPEGVTSIGSSAFSYCSKLTSVTFAEGSLLTSIWASAFRGCSSLSSILIPDSVTSIGSSAFNGCSSLVEMTIPFIGAVAGKTSNDTYQYPFGYIFGSSSYTGGTAVEQYYYGSYADGRTSSTFYIPSSLRSVTVTGGDILYGAFRNCSMLTSIEIPEGVTSIVQDAFYNCRGLTTITIPSSVTSIRQDAFSYCRHLVEVYNKSSLKITKGGSDYGNVGYYAKAIYTSEYVSKLSTDEKGYVLYTDGGSISLITYIGTDTELILPDGISEINQYAFYYCSSLTSIEIPSSVTGIEDYAFSDCSSLTSVTFAEGSLLTSIGSSAFYYCSLLTSIVIPEGVTSIGSSAFYYCARLTSIVIPDSVTSIGSSAFSYCYHLVEVYNKSSLNITKGGSDNGCVGYYAKAIYTSEYVSKLSTDEKGYVLYTDGGLMSVIAYTGSDTELILPDGITEINQFAFYWRAGMTSVTIPDSVTSIGSYAFYSCRGFTSITIPASVTSIGSYAFADCRNLTSIYYTGDIAGWCNISGSGNPMAYGSSSKSLYIGGRKVEGELVIPEGVTSIGSSAFYDCSGLTSITIPSSVTSIGEDAFSGCSGLTSIYYTGDIAGWCGISGSGNLMAYGSSSKSLYVGGTKVEGELVIPEGVTGIEASAFSGCSDLTSIEIPDSVTSIGKGAFSGCSSLAEITIPFVGGSKKTSTDTYQYPFGYIFGTSSYTGGTKVTQYYYGSSTSSTTYDYYYIPSTLRSVTVTGGNILYGAFRNCSMLVSITIPSSVTSIGDYAFYGCSSLTSIEIPEGVTSIGQYAFYNCSGLISVTIPDSVTSIVYGAFYGCSSLVEMTIPFVGGSKKTSTDTCQYPFGYIFGTSSYTGGVAVKQYYYEYSISSTTSTTYYIPSSLRSVTVTGGSILRGAFYNCSMLTSVSIPDSVTSIGTYAFCNCFSLTSITIPNSVNSIGESAFYGCSSLAEITIPFVGAVAGKTSADTYQYPFGYIFGTSSYTGGTEVTQYYYGSSTSSTTNDYYYIPSTLRSVTVTGGNILYGAFRNCSMLVSITIPSSVTSIGNYAFYNCRGLTSITIPSSVTSIGDDAFYNCSGLTSITIPSSVTSIGDDAFHNCSGLTSITVEEGNQKYHSAGNCLIESETKELIAGCNTSVIPNDGTVTSIGSYAFYNCRGLTSVSIPNSVTSIGSNAFRVCSGLTSVSIPDSVTIIGASAFQDCRSLTSITIPDSVTSIGSSAFSGCSGLISVTIGSSVTSIGVLAFVGCSGLTSVTIPSSVTSIGSYAFRGCSGLTSITFQGTKAQWSAIKKEGDWNYNTGNYTVHCTDVDIAK